MTIEKQLGTLAGNDDESRVEVIQIAEPGETPTLEIRMQHHTDEIGWQTHRRVAIAPGQVGALRDMLNMMDPDARDTVIDHNTDVDEASPALELISENTG
jgi:hypothetical protein